MAAGPGVAAFDPTTDHHLREVATAGDQTIHTQTEATAAAKDHTQTAISRHHVQALFTHRPEATSHFAWISLQAWVNPDLVALVSDCRMAGAVDALQVEAVEEDAGNRHLLPQSAH